MSKPELDAVTIAILAAQKDGPAKLDEMVYVLDNLIANKRVDMEPFLVVSPDLVDLPTWGRKMYVLEQILSLLQRLASDSEMQAYIRGRLKYPQPKAATVSNRTDRAGDSVE